ncbi:MAG: trehalase family glycosidase, partial [Rhodothermales bacterium]
MELGWLGDVRPGDTYDVQFFSEAGRLGRRVGYAVPPGRTDARMDGHLEAYDGPPIPTQVRMEAGLLSWASEGAVNIYRRRYPESVYTLQATVTDARTWSDAAMEPGALYGYVLTGLDAMGEPGMHSVEATSLPASRFVDHVARGEAGVSNAMVRVVAYQESVTLEPGATHTLRVVRLVQPEREDPARLLEAGRRALAEPLDAYLAADRAWQAGLRLDRFRDRDERLLFLSAANMMTQVFYPPEGEASYPYYVFSREPTWGWGHGGQVFHESLTMLAYAQIDPKGAMDSQRLYAERQHPNGYINYRTGAYLNEVILHNDTLTSSAPWYAWQNYEVYRETGDRAFLETMYASSARFYRFYVSNRDADGDGLAEWGGHAVLESVRDAAVAVWDEVGWPAQFDGVDVNSMLVMEAKSLEAMALELGLAEEAAEWRADHERRAALINRFMWDPETAFYYNIDRRDNDFSYSTENDLKRKEIIGFLPLWAGIADSSQAAALVRHLTDTTSFWRPYGIPSLAADDPYYHPKGYWNGPVWVEWNYLIYHGLRAYGYDREADALTQKNAEALIAGLRSTHNLWEFYSPDEAWAGYHRTYIWAGIINRMLADRAVR